MTDPISSLTDDQTIRAVRIFYDISPSEIWEEQKKPSPARVKTVAAALAQSAPAELRPAVDTLLADDQPASAPARAEVCRFLLRQLRESPDFLPFVDRAVETARQPHMAIDPITGAFVICLLLATTKFKRSADGSLDVISGGTMLDALKEIPKLLHELPPVLKAIPASLWQAIVGLGK